MAAGLASVLASALVAAAPAWEVQPGFRLTALQSGPAPQTGFTLLPSVRTGITFTNPLPESRLVTNQVLPNGSGVAAGDVDGDGWCDLYFGGLAGSSRLYRNLGDWRFEDRTAEAGVARPAADVTGAVFADLDGDRDLDLVVNSIGAGTRLFFNDGRGRFTVGPTLLNLGAGGTSLALADADGDGDLDLYLANYRTSTLMDAPGTRFTIKMAEGQPYVAAINGRPPTDAEWTNRFRFTFDRTAGGRGRFAREELGEADVFLQNDGRGAFTPVPWTGGAFLDAAGQPLSQPPFDWGLSVLFRDLTGDGRPDLYVCNDFATPDRFWLNQGNGRFQLAPPLTFRQQSLAAMAVDAADLDRDGDDELLVVEMLSREHGRRLTQRNVVQGESAEGEQIEGLPQYPRNMLFLNRGDGTYAEIAQFAGLEASEWSWGPLFLDVDLDGYEDLLVPNGFERDNMNADVQARIQQSRAGPTPRTQDELQLRRLFPRLNTANLAFRNLGDLRFTECSAAWGFHQPTISQGSCLADLDNDGDLDVVVNNLNSAAGVYRNDTAAPRLAVRLHGHAPNTGGIGARVLAEGGPVPQSQEFVAGGRYCSSDQPQRTFATGAAQALTVRVRWRRGHESVVTNLPPNTLVEIAEPPAPAIRPSPPAPRQPPSASRFEFVDASRQLGHAHRDAPFDDFERQPLLPRKLSQLGPGVAWWDLDGDHRDDLIIGGGRGGGISGYRNLGDGRFAPIHGGRWDEPLQQDATGMAGWSPGTLLIAFSNYEEGGTHLPGAVTWNQAGTPHALPLPAAGHGPIAAADYDGDGDLDVLVGTRSSAGRYPQPERPTLWRHQDGAFQPDPDNTSRLPPTLVSAALWTDLTGDGWPDLVLAGDWGPVRLFRNDRGRLNPWNPRIEWPATTRDPPAGSPLRRPGQSNPESITLADLTGWWQGIAAGDLDNDGRLDLVAANWGANTRYQRGRPAALTAAWGDVDQDGIVEILEGHYVPELRAEAPDRMLDTVSRGLPQLADRFTTHADWSRADLPTILAQLPALAQRVEAAWLESTVFLNRGESFEVRLLPTEAQFAPAFAVCIGDADGDGHEDVFLSQNFFGVPRDTSRHDAGRGLWLRGDGQGGFLPVPGQDSGVRIYGEQRGAALADFDADGRVDLVVAQNHAETRLFRNRGATPGLRVRLAGPRDNPLGIGAVVRLHQGSRAGPVREVRSGGGYWSQDSPVTVLSLGEPPRHLEVRWPGGVTQTHPLPAEAREVIVRSNGGLDVVR